MQDAHAAGQSFYDYYVAARITGFTSHWNTYAAEEMFALLMLAAFLFFAPGAAKRLWLWIAAAALVTLAVLLSDTRGVWIATFVGGLYLVWYWNRKLILLVPIARNSGVPGFSTCDSRTFRIHCPAQAGGFQ